MAIAIETVSTETIKPSSPTPLHLRKYHFSLLDQVASPRMMPCVLFYEPHSDNIERSNKLKTSLSQTLTRFYPFAGQIIDSLYVDCNDRGVLYIEARCNCKLLDFILDPNPKDLNKFIPCELDDKDHTRTMVIQTTLFECGGMAVAIATSHKLADAATAFLFNTTWAAIARGCGDSNVISPLFNSSTLFPPLVLMGHKPSQRLKEKIVTKRFVFAAAKIDALRDKYSGIRRPSATEALSAFIWSRFMASTQVIKPDVTSKSYTVAQAVNIRTRMDPPLPNNSFGNLVLLAVATPSMDNYDGIINQMRDEISNVDGKYVKKLQEGDRNDFVNFLKERDERIFKGDLINFTFTSLHRFPMYEANFGWGKPIWVGMAIHPSKNLVLFLGTRWGDGIETWIHLKEEDMAKFEVDMELLSYISPTPSP